MARDNYKDVTIADAKRRATDAVKQLGGLNGDPSRAASWIRERDFAWIILALVSRIEEAAQTIEVPR